VRLIGVSDAVLKISAFGGISRVILKVPEALSRPTKMTAWPTLNRCSLMIFPSARGILPLVALGAFDLSGAWPPPYPRYARFEDTF
jgi:hypothetical protein